MEAAMLKKLGMTGKEIKLYLKLLEYDTSAASILARAIGENRTSTYSLLNAMVKKGFASYFTKGNVKYFSATSPKLLIDHFIDDANGLKAFLPQLMAITNKHGHKPKITFYEGVEGIKQIAEILLEVPGSTRESFMGIDNKTMHPEIRKFYEEDFVNRRIAKNIKYRGIVTDKLPKATNYKDTDAAHLRELKYIDPKILPMKIHIDIFPHNKVAIYSYNKDEMMGVVIEHESFYQTMRTVFKLAWAGVDVLG